MQSRASIVQELNDLIAETDRLDPKGADPLLRAFRDELRRYIALATDHWPLTDAEKETVDIGRVAVRELDPQFPDYVTRLSEVGAALRNAV